MTAPPPAPRYIVREFDTRAYVLGMTPQGYGIVSRHDLISDAYAEADRLNAAGETVAGPVEIAFREGFKAGYERGSAEATAYEWGARVFGVPNEDEAWADSDARVRITENTEGGRDAG